MINDKWQLHNWETCQCIANPNPRARTIIIIGLRPNRFLEYYCVSFSSRKELTHFVLKYSNLFVPISTYKYEYTTKELVWNHIKIDCLNVKYTDGPYND